MAKRQSTGKRLRFEIFKRDGFTCQYCGQQPPDVVLVVDHIMAVAKGGNNDPMNLITACEACNQGKSDKSLGTISPKPDADLEWLAMQQEISELRRYQIARQEREAVMHEIVLSLQELWIQRFCTSWPATEAEITKWLTLSSPELVERAICAAATKKDLLRAHLDRLKYTSAVLRNMMAEEDRG